MKTVSLKPLVIGIAIATVGTFAQKADAGTNAGKAGAFLRMGLGARDLAMGDVGVALPGNPYGIYYNPASLPFLQKKTALVTYNYLALDRRFHFIGFASPLHPPAGHEGEKLSAGVGVGWINAGSGDIDGRDRDGYPIGTFRNAENAFYFSFALRLTDYFSVGFSPVILYNSFPDLTQGESLSSTRLGFDAGVLVNPYPNLYLGAQARHINAQYRWDTSTFWGQEGATIVNKFPQIYRIGAAYNFGAILPGLTVAGDYETSDQEDQQIHIGGEWVMQNFEPYQFAVRAGYDDQNPAFGLGFGFSVWKLSGQLDYVYQIQDVPPWDTQVISFAVSF
jgi:hypothetical protein